MRADFLPDADPILQGCVAAIEVTAKDARDSLQERTRAARGRAAISIRRLSAVALAGDDAVADDPQSGGAWECRVSRSSGRGLLSSARRTRLTAWAGDGF
jgi:hypothetical protein